MASVTRSTFASRRATRPAAVVMAVAAACVSCAAGPSVIPAADARIAVMGRVDRGQVAGRDATTGALRFGYPGVTLRLAFEGSALSARLSGSTANSRLAVIVDGGPARTVRVARGESTVALATGLPRGAHHVDIVHRTETWQGIVTVRGFVLGPGDRLLTAPPWPGRRLLFIGDSVTCGEAIDRSPDARRADAVPPDCDKDTAATSNGALSYGMLLGRALAAQAHLVCYGGRGLIRDWRGNRTVANAPRFFDLAIVDPPVRADWDHAAYVPDAVVVSLGTNDFNHDLGAFPDREEYVMAYVALIREIRRHAPAAHVFITEGAIVDDETHPEQPAKSVLRAIIAETVRRLADDRVHIFESAHHAGDACNAHPTRSQHEEMARALEGPVRSALGW